MINTKNTRTTRTTRTTTPRHEPSDTEIVDRLIAISGVDAIRVERSTSHPVSDDIPSDSIAPKPRQAPNQPRGRSPGDPAKQPNDWVVTCFSASPNELAAIDAVVEKFRAAGIRKMSRSRLIRIAVSKLDLDEVIASMRGVL